MSGNVGVYAEYTGYFNGNFGLLSSTTRMQDNLYYQDFSYVVKTDQDVETYRDKILELVHPAGMAMFGEILMTANLSVTLFDNATRNINTTQANTAQVANSVNVPLYNFHEIEFYTSNTASTNNQVLVESSYGFSFYPSALGAQFDAKMDTTGASTDFDLQLEHGNDLFSLEVSGFFLAFENTGELLLEIDIDGEVGDRLIEETADFLLTEAETIHVLLEEDSQVSVPPTDILLLDDGTTTNDTASVIGALADENQSVSSPIIYEFAEAQLGRITTEDDDGIEINLTGTDTLQIDESAGDFIVMDGFDVLNNLQLEDGRGHLLLDEVTIFGGHIAFETRGTVLLNSTDGAPGSDAGDKIISENFILSTDVDYLLNEESDDSTTSDGAYIAQEDPSSEYTGGVWYHYFSQGGKIKQESDPDTFHYVLTEGNLIQENDAFVILEQQVLAEKERPLSLERPEGDLQETVYVELEQAIGGDSTIRKDLISHFVLEERDDETLSIILEDDSGDLLYEFGSRILLFEQAETATIRILNEEEFSNFKVEDFDSALELETHTDNVQDRDANLRSFFLFEDDDDDARSYLLEEPTTISQHIVSEDPNN